MFTEDKVTEIFFMADKFCKFFDQMMAKYTVCDRRKRSYHRTSTMSKAEIMVILIPFHNAGYHCLKHFYLQQVCKRMRHLFPAVVSHNHFVELERDIQGHDRLSWQKYGKLRSQINIIPYICKKGNKNMKTKEFWDIDKMFCKEIKDGRVDEARHLLYRMTQLYPHVVDNDLTANKAVIHNALALDKAIANFNLAYFVPYAIRLAETDWKGVRRNGRIIPSLGQRITNRLMSGIAQRSDEYIRGVMPFFRTALQHNPSNKDNLRHLAQLYVRVKLKAQAVTIYKQLLRRYDNSYLYAELAELMPEARERIALLCQAIAKQPKEAYNTGYRYRLAELLQMPEPTRAAYEINRSVAARKKAGHAIPADVDRMARLLAAYAPVSEADQTLFYEQQKAVADAIIGT